MGSRFLGAPSRSICCSAPATNVNGLVMHDHALCCPCSACQQSTQRHQRCESQDCKQCSFSFHQLLLLLFRSIVLVDFAEFREYSLNLGCSQNPAKSTQLISAVVCRNDWRTSCRPMSQQNLLSDVILQRDAMQARPQPSCGVCLSVCLSVCHVRTFCQNE